MQKTPLLAAISPNVFPQPHDWENTCMAGFIPWYLSREERGETRQVLTLILRFSHILISAQLHNTIHLCALSPFVKRRPTWQILPTNWHTLTIYPQTDTHLLSIHKLTHTYYLCTNWHTLTICPQTDTHLLSKPFHDLPLTNWHTLTIICLLTNWHTLTI